MLQLGGLFQSQCVSMIMGQGRGYTWQDSALWVTCKEASIPDATTGSEHFHWMQNAEKPVVAHCDGANTKFSNIIKPSKNYY